MKDEIKQIDRFICGLSETYQQLKDKLAEDENSMTEIEFDVKNNYLEGKLSAFAQIRDYINDNFINEKQ